MEDSTNSGRDSEDLRQTEEGQFAEPRSKDDLLPSTSRSSSGHSRKRKLGRESGTNLNPIITRPDNLRFMFVEGFQIQKNVWVEAFYKVGDDIFTSAKLVWDSLSPLDHSITNLKSITEITKKPKIETCTSKSTTESSPTHNFDLNQKRETLLNILGWMLRMKKKGDPYAYSYGQNSYKNIPQEIIHQIDNQVIPNNQITV